MAQTRLSIYVLHLKIIAYVLIARCLELYWLNKALVYAVINQFVAVMVTTGGRTLVRFVVGAYYILVSIL